MKNINVIIGKTIRKIRKERRITQEELAEYSGIHEKHIGRIEAGKHSVSIDSLQKLAEGLNTSVAEILRITFEVSKRKSKEEIIISEICSFLRTQSLTKLKVIKNIIFELKKLK